MEPVDRFARVVRRDVPRFAPRVIPALLTAAVAMAPLACSEPADKAAMIGAADAYTAIIRWEVAANPRPPGGERSEDLPVIYVTSALGDRIDATTQASVADATKDDAVVRFADKREDVVDLDDPTEPVKEERVMLLVGPLPEPARRVEVDVVRYRSLSDQRSYALVLGRDGDGARVTSATEAPG